MCGVYGWLGEPLSGAAEFLRLGGQLLQHRGPDDEGEACGSRWALGFRRLAILDLTEAGHQPMTTPDGRVHLVFNGEVYNHVELREDLLRRGVRLRGTSDTEVVLWMLVLDGAAALETFNGMFALALVDERTRSFLLARDRLGVKPLYLRREPGHLRFASELKALLGWSGASRDLSQQAVVEYLAYGYLSSDTCILDGYEKLRPGHVMVGSLDDPGRAVQRAYWSLGLSRGEPFTSASEVAELLQDAVRIRLRSDVPVGVFLSGGLDSGLVAVLAARAARAEGRDPPVALTVGFAEGQYDESPAAAAAAKAAGMEHVVVQQRADALEDLDRLAWFFDEPFGDSSALAMFALSRAAAEVGTVFLSGDGGDEAFAGYRRYEAALRYRRLDRVPPLGRQLVRAAARRFPQTSSARYRLVKATAPDGAFAAAFDDTPEDPVVALLLHPRLRGDLPGVVRSQWDRWGRWAGLDLTSRQRRLDYEHYLPDDVLVKVDRASMAHSLEVRSPFLDPRLVARAAATPTEQLLSDGLGKLPLRALAAELLPAAARTAPKRGFEVPVDVWFRQASGQAFLRERLLGPEGFRLGLWDTTAVERVALAHCRRGSRQFGQLLWRLLVLEAWQRTHLGSVRRSGLRCA
ncbi:MAG: hypothetical protein JWM02_1831 [Frankiales bacterium]|nr:hypothetical protein [Frankiales bacterium]